MQLNTYDQSKNTWPQSNISDAIKDGLPRTGFSASIVDNSASDNRCNRLLPLSKLTEDVDVELETWLSDPSSPVVLFFDRPPFLLVAPLFRTDLFGGCWTGLIVGKLDELVLPVRFGWFFLYPLVGDKCRLFIGDLTGLLLVFGRTDPLVP